MSSKLKEINVSGIFLATFCGTNVFSKIYLLETKFKTRQGWQMETNGSHAGHAEPALRKIVFPAMWK